MIVITSKVAVLTLAYACNWQDIVIEGITREESLTELMYTCLLIPCEECSHRVQIVPLVVADDAMIMMGCKVSVHFFYRCTPYALSECHSPHHDLFHSAACDINHVTLQISCSISQEIIVRIREFMLTAA